MNEFHARDDEKRLRIEVLRDSPLVIADAAHNTASMSALVNTLRTLFPVRRTAIVAVARDKDVADMLRIAGSYFDHLILTRFTSNPRATPVADLAAIAEQVGVRDFSMIESPQHAWESAIAGASPQELICITGSFFLGAELRDMIVSGQAG